VFSKVFIAVKVRTAICVAISCSHVRGYEYFAACLKREAVGSSETSVTVYTNTQRPSPEGHKLQHNITYHAHHIQPHQLVYTRCSRREARTPHAVLRRVLCSQRTCLQYFVTCMAKKCLPDVRKYFLFRHTCRCKQMFFSLMYNVILRTTARLTDDH
jgi:hypothetical protein